VSKPQLLVVAGCNGSGKSTYSKSLSPSDTLPFDYDKYFLDIYNAMSDSELRERMSHHQAFEMLEQSVESAIKNRLSFCYETNFNSTPMHWPEKFRSNGYEINMIYFCLNSVDEAKKRVQIRYENGGHYVPDNEVEERFYLGYKYLDEHFTDFDHVHLLDSSFYDSEPCHIASLISGKVESITKYPEYLIDLLPKITTLSFKGI
jgi:predicted ABC-type ATPase